MTVGQLLEVPGNIAAQTQKGLPASAIETLREKLDLSAGDVRQAAAISSRSLTRRRAARRLSGLESDRLVRFASVASYAVSVLGTPAKAGRWLRSPIFALNRQRPIDLLKTQAGSEEILSVLSAIAYGGVT